MKVIKNINNTVAHCTDSRGREVIVFGKGIGFRKPGEEIPLSEISRTFYNIKDTDFAVLRTIPTVIINTAVYIVDYVSEKLSIYFPSSTAIALADHLQFAIERKDKNIYLSQPIIEDIRQLYPEEMEAAYEALKIIKRATGESLPRIEAGTLAMHFINDRIQVEDEVRINTADFIRKAAAAIEEHFGIEIDRENFNYSRFATHLDYLIRRLSNNEQSESCNAEMFEQMKTQFPDSMACAEKISNLMKRTYGFVINDEELMYLTVHINRMISRI